MQIDRKYFFDETRKLLKSQGKQLTQARVDALEFLLSQFEKNENWRDQRHIAYALATTAHETAWTFEPIIERGAKSYFNKYEPGTKIGKDLGNTQKGDGYTFRGRGYVQLTGRKNYERYGIENAPDMALDPYRAFDIMTDGMFNGRYTGKSFANYINASKTDYVNARRIINGTDKAKHIADIAIAFKRALKTVKPSIKVTASDLTDKDREELSLPKHLEEIALPETPTQENQAESLPIRLPSFDTVQQQIPRINTARTWLGGLGLGGSVSTFIASLVNLPPWAIFTLGAVTAIIFIVLGWLLVTYNKQLFALVNRVVGINADPTQGTVQLVSRSDTK